MCAESSYQTLATVCSAHVNSTRSIFAKVCADVQATCVQMDGEDDHVHLLAGGAPISIVCQYIEQQKAQD
jgi:putative transposase